MEANMAHAPRRASESGIYHVVSRGVSHCITFEDDNDRVRFLEIFEELVRSNEVTVFAWCLMENHYHILLKMELAKLSRLMMALNSEYALYFNSRHARVGHLFQGRYRSEPVDGDEHFLTVLRYIHQNPVKAGVSPTCDWPWSSYRAYILSSKAIFTNLVSTKLALGLLGGVANLAQFHEEKEAFVPSVDVEDRRKRVNDCDVLEVARAALGGVAPHSVVGLPRAERNVALASLRSAQLSVRQIERATGVSRGIIESVKPSSKT